MDVEEYSRSYALAVEEAEASSAGPGNPGSGSFSDEVERLLNVLQDGAEEPGARRVALAGLAERSFLVSDFRPHLTGYVGALRAVATDPDPELRGEALDLLALRKDEYAQRLLTDGLQDSTQALVPAARAVQMLGYDLHAEHHELLRDIVATSKRRRLRTEALQLLAADSGSKDLFDRILRDKAEGSEVRRTSAVALNSLAPEEFAVIAQEIVLDETDDDDLRATCLTALSHGPGPAGDGDLGTRVLDTPAAKSAQLTRAAHQYERAVRGADDG